jgi:hypothetical protein
MEKKYRYNFRTDFRDFSNCRRTYAWGDKNGKTLKLQIVKDGGTIFVRPRQPLTVDAGQELLPEAVL